jgi:hypothetical protein
MEEETKDKVPIIEYHQVLKDSKDVFRKILGFTPKKYIDFSIKLIPGVAPVSNTPYRMSTLELKELKCNLKNF